MKTIWLVILGYIAAMSLVTFIAYGVDKWKARNAHWRISELTLILMALLGGSPGALAGMKIWHHKTLHRKFRYGIPAIILLQVLTVFAVVYLIYF